MKSRLSILLSAKSVRFIERYKKASGIATTSETIERALDLLERQELFDIFTQMGRDAQLGEAVELGKEAAEDFLDDTW